MKTWLGLVLAPGIALGAQSLMYSMVTPACGAQMQVGLHLAAAVALILVLVLAVVAFSDSSLRGREPDSADSDEADAPVPRRFLADAATAVAGLSALVILGMWFALFVLSPCAP
jgi:Zn-dependent protease